MELVSNHIATHCTFIYLRLRLAALHFNENSGRAHAVTKQGNKCYDIAYPKYKQGGYVVRKVLVDATYSKIQL